MSGTILLFAAYLILTKNTAQTLQTIKTLFQKRSAGQFLLIFFTSFLGLFLLSTLFSQDMSGHFLVELVALAEATARTATATDALSFAKAAGLVVAQAAGGAIIVNETFVSAPDAKGSRALKGGTAHETDSSREQPQANAVPQRSPRLRYEERFSQYSGHP